MSVVLAYLRPLASLAIRLLPASQTETDDRPLSQQKPIGQVKRFVERVINDRSLEPAASQLASAFEKIPAFFTFFLAGLSSGWVRCQRTNKKSEISILFSIVQLFYLLSSLENFF